MKKLKKKKIVFVAGGVGTAPVYPQVKWLHEHGIDADVIVGAKTKDLLILEDEMRSCQVIFTLQQMTDPMDVKGMGTRYIEDLVQNQGKQYDRMCCHRTYDHDEICLSD